jgi:hypothetical protein
LNDFTENYSEQKLFLLARGNHDETVRVTEDNGLKSLLFVFNIKTMQLEIRFAGNFTSRLSVKTSREFMYLQGEAVSSRDDVVAIDECS